MRKFLVKVYSDCEGQKITAIKNIRSALGIGLVEAKTFIESGQRVTTEVVLNGLQVAKLLEASFNDSSGIDGKPYLNIRFVKEITSSGLDFSTSEPHVHS